MTRFQMWLMLRSGLHSSGPARLIFDELLVELPPCLTRPEVAGVTNCPRGNAPCLLQIKSAEIESLYQKNVTTRRTPFMGEPP